MKSFRAKTNRVKTKRLKTERVELQISSTEILVDLADLNIELLRNKNFELKIKNLVVEREVQVEHLLGILVRTPVVTESRPPNVKKTLIQ